MAVVRQPLADSQQVADYLAVSVRTLDDWAHRGNGPAYSRVGRHRRYRWSDVEQYVDDQRRDRDEAAE